MHSDEDLAQPKVKFKKNFFLKKKESHRPLRLWLWLTCHLGAEVQPKEMMEGGEADLMASGAGEGGDAHDKCVWDTLSVTCRPDAWSWIM